MNRTKRIEEILLTLSSGNAINTPQLALKYNVSNKIIQTDFKDYILPYLSKYISYSFSSKTYNANTNFLDKTLLSAHELSIIIILYSKSGDKYSDDTLQTDTKVLFKEFEENLSHSFYQKTSIEKLDNFKEEIILIKNAIDKKQKISCRYREKDRVLSPIKILNLEGFWYLVNYDSLHNDIRKYHLNSIENITILTDSFVYNKELIDKLDNAVNAYYKPEIKPILVELFLEPDASKFFIRKPISQSQSRSIR